MPRAIWTKLQTDPNGTWTRHDGEPPFSISVIGGMTYDVYTDSGDSFEITPQAVPEMPVLSGVPTIAGTAQVGQTLTATAAPSTGTTPITTTWQWLRDGAAISGATSSTYALTSTDEGKSISVRQTDTNAHGSDSATSATLTVAATGVAPTISGVPTIAGTAQVGQTLTATAAPSTGTAPIATTWQWLRDGAAISGATSSTYALTSTDEGKSISVRQIATNAYGSHSATSAAQTVQPEVVGVAPTLSGAPVVAGTHEVGQTLNATAAPSTGTAPIATTWQWLRDGAVISGATVNTYALLDIDEGRAISVRQTDTNAHGSDSAISTARTVAAAPAAPVLSGVPTMAGIAQVGQTLTATAAPSTGTAPIATTWQWLRNGTAISGATSASYMLVSADEGTGIAVRQTDTNTHGSDSATSAAHTVQAQSTGGVAVISGLFVADQTATGEVALAYSISQDSAVAGVLTRAAITPSAAQITSGQDHLGAPAASAFSDFWTTGSSDTLPNITAGLPKDIYYLHVLPAGGGNGDAVSSNGFTLETASPAILSAQTTESGDQIDIQFSETLVGSSSETDWVLTADGTNIPVSTVSLAKDLVTLTLSGLVRNGQTLALSYTGTGLADAVANRVAGFSGLAVTNAVVAGFTENSVTVPVGTYLTSTEPLPTNARSLLFFSSLTQQAGYDSRVALATWDGVNGGFHSQYISGTGTCGIRLRLQDGTANINQTDADVPIGTRYHTLVSAWIDGTNMRAIAWILNTATGAWTQVVNETAATGADTAFSLTANNLRLFARSDKVIQEFAGTVNRVALWAGTGAAPMADITQAGVRDMFASDAGLADPALSRVSLGQPLMDFHGKAADYNAGIHSGSLKSFARTGTFS